MDVVNMNVVESTTTVAVDTTSPEVFLDNLATLKETFNFVKDQNKVELDFDTNQELQRVKEHFQKLKNDYLALETKQLMMEGIATDGLLDQMTADDITALEQSVDEGKTALKTVKTNIRELKTQLHDIIAVLVGKLARFDAHKSEFDAVYDKENAAANAHTRIDAAAVTKLNDETQCYGKSDAADLRQNTPDQCRRVVEQQLAVMHTIGAEMAVVEASCRATTETLTPLLARVSSLQRESDEMAAATTRAASTTTTTSTAHSWFTSVNRIAHALSGVTVTDVTDDVDNNGLGDDDVAAGVNRVLRIVVAQQPSATSTSSSPADDVTMRVYCTASKSGAAANTIAFTRITTSTNTSIDNTQGNNATTTSRFDDIVAHAVRTQSLPFLCREVQLRVRNVRRRAAHLAELATRYPVQQTTDAATDAVTVSVTLPHNIVAVLELTTQYGSPFAPVYLTSVKKSTSTTKKKKAVAATLTTLMNRVNAEIVTSTTKSVADTLKKLTTALDGAGPL